MPKPNKYKAGWYRTSTASTTQRGYGNDWRRLRVIVMRRDRGLCQCDECKKLGRIRVAHEVDHIIPKSQGGTDDLSNLQAINRECHKAKTARDSGYKPRPVIGLDGWPIKQ
jgi:5-methylcytosine-specific restriction protein A